MERPETGTQPAYPGALTDKNICSIFNGAGDFVSRKITCGRWTLYAYAIDGLVSGGDMSDYVIKPAMELLRGDTMEALYHSALQGAIYNAVADPCTDLDTVALKLVNGFCVVLFPEAGAVAFEVKTGEKRGLSAPEVENTVKGPKDAFVETVRSNTSLIRRHLRTPDLRLYETQVGRRSLTNVSVVWIEGLTNQTLVERMKKRLSDIDIDGLLSPSAVEEYITGSRMTAFPMLQYTERTDRYCQGLLDGRVGLLVDGLPLGYLAPADLMYLMDSAEDRSRDFMTASAVRILRYLALVTGLLLPGIYIALATFHQAVIPLPLLRSIIESKESVPFSTTTEVLGLLIAFELLQESGIHLPQAIGQSVSIVGGIVMGSAAVEAGLMSPIALIAVSIAGIAGFVLPNRDLAQAVRGWRFCIAVISALCGLWGTAAGALVLLIHLLSLKSLGVRYLTVSGGGMIRPRLKKLKWRNKKLHPQDRRNQR
jgi:hypothetical protein